jgi:hypothetical protein
MPLMKAEQRPAVAALAAALANKQNVKSIYDHGTGQYVNIDVDISNDQIKAYDYSRSAHLSGPTISVYDYGVGAYIQLQLSGSTVDGYDYASGQHFQAQVTGKSVWLYDYETSQYYSFTVT